MGLAEFVDQVGQVLTAKNVTTPQLVGAKHVRGHDAPVRCVWVSQGGAGDKAQPTKEHPRSIATRKLSVQVYIFAGDYAACELLLAQIASAVRLLAMGAHRFVGEGPPLADAVNLARGECIVAKFELQFPVDDFPAQAVTITGANLQAVQSDPSGNPDSDETIVDAPLSP